MRRRSWRARPSKPAMPAWRCRVPDEGVELSEFVSTPRGMASPDPGARAHAIDHFKRMVEVAVELGARMVNTVAPTAFELPVPRITDKHLRQEWGMDLAPDL